MYRAFSALILPFQNTTSLILWFSSVSSHFLDVSGNNGRRCLRAVRCLALTKSPTQAILRVQMFTPGLHLDNQVFGTDGYCFHVRCVGFQLPDILTGF